MDLRAVPAGGISDIRPALTSLSHPILILPFFFTPLFQNNDFRREEWVYSSLSGTSGASMGQKLLSAVTGIIPITQRPIAGGLGIEKKDGMNHLQGVPNFPSSLQLNFCPFVDKSCQDRGGFGLIDAILFFFRDIHVAQRGGRTV
jgi:hypothetical protein